MSLAGKIIALASGWFIEPRPKLYSAERLRRRERFRADYRLLARALLNRLEFGSMLDIGCANGFIMSEFKRAGKEVRGVDLSPDVKAVLDTGLEDLVKIEDFSQTDTASDLVCCVEMAEHVLPERSLELVAKLTSLARNWIYFTAAPPGQLGYAHINCRPHSQWLCWFEAQGWTSNQELTLGLREDLQALRKAVWLRRNSFVLSPKSKINGARVRELQTGLVSD